YERFARWEADGTWAKLLEYVQVRDDAVGRVQWTVAVDSTVNRAHQHAAGARKRGTRPGTNWMIRATRRRRQAL
ncbi:IS5/IS1182 family transposase, partial [Streptomyces sp. SID6648]|nr:IS5/IS1182 family transposase [Streptomyces sp. SID6648]